MKASRKVYEDLIVPKITSNETSTDTPLITSKITSNETSIDTPNNTPNNTPIITSNDTPIVTSSETPKKKFNRPSDPKTKRTFAFDAKVLKEWLEFCGEDWGEQTARINALLLDDVKKRRKAQNKKHLPS